MNSRTLKFGIPAAFLAVAMVAALAMWAFMGASAGSLKDSAGIKGMVEWSVFDASGNLKQHYVNHNTTMTVLKTDARTALGNIAAPIGSATTAYDNIQLLNADKSGIPTANGDLSTPANITEGNPKSATYAAVGDNAYTATQTFTATGAVVIEELNLTNGAVTGGTYMAGVGAWQNVSVTLAATDTLQVTWTITVN